MKENTPSQPVPPPVNTLPPVRRSPETRSETGTAVPAAPVESVRHRGSRGAVPVGRPAPLGLISYR
ncbi:MAG: hypothetical protein SFU56_11430 [Capsulimonadales bacterium]|nr:hypothetical protein [Capsulimonadales bacterium]